MTPNPLVLQVIPTLSIGGAERFAIELSARLPANGFRTRLVSLFESGPLYTEIRERDIRWKQLMPSHCSSRTELVRRLRVILTEEGERCPVIVHTHLFGSDFWMSVARLSAGQFRGIKHRPIFVSTAHNIDNEDGALRHILRKWAVQRMDRVVAVSEDVCAYAIKDLGVRRDRAMWTDGMNFSQPSPRPGIPFHDPPRLISVGRLVPQKGYETILHALANVSLPWAYDIIGGGPLERDLKELAEKLGIASRVRFLGARLDTTERLRDADLFLFPSHWEGLGSSAIEAGSCGLPVLASRLSPLVSVFPDSQLLPIDDASAWEKAIVRVLRDPDDALRRASRLAPSIRERFDPDRIVEAYAEIYRELLTSQ